MKVTIKDVAREANVSIATVSRVINGKDRVKKATRLKIEEAIKKLNFRPDQAARTMIMKETKTIGLVVPVLANEYWARFSEVIQGALWEEGYTLITGIDNTDPEKHKAVLNIFQERKVDGVILGGPFRDFIKEYIRIFEQGELPLVSLSSISPNINCVTNDNLQGAMEAVQHLTTLGHKSIAYIGSALTTTTEREMGYRNSLMMKGIKVNEAIIMNTNDIVHDFSRYGYEAAQQLIQSKETFTAVFCATDLMAIGAMKAFGEAGIKVPEQMAVVGYDDISMANLYQPSLTTIKQPIQEMGKAAVNLLLDLIHDTDESIAKKITFPVQLVIRESCGAKQIRDVDSK